MDPEQPAQQSIDYRTADDFTSRYANNVFLENTLWDLKLIFGQTDQRAGLNVVVQFGSVALSWPQIKILSYYLRAHLASHEASNGRIVIQPGIIPAIPDKLPDGLTKQRGASEGFEAVRKLYEELVRENPELSVSEPPKTPPSKSKQR